MAIESSLIYRYIENGAFPVRKVQVRLPEGNM